MSKRRRKRDYIVIHEDGWQEFISAREKMNDSTYEISNRDHGTLATLHSNGNGYTFTEDDREIRLSYATADYLLNLMLAANDFNRYAKIYELKDAKEK